MRYFRCGGFFRPRLGRACLLTYSLVLALPLVGLFFLLLHSIFFLVPCHAWCCLLLPAEFLCETWLAFVCLDDHSGFFFFFWSPGECGLGSIVVSFVLRVRVILPSGDVLELLFSLTTFSTVSHVSAPPHRLRGERLSLLMNQDMRFALALPGMSGRATNRIHLCFFLFCRGVLPTAVRTRSAFVCFVDAAEASSSVIVCGGW